jgi:hypothetical protein
VTNAIWIGGRKIMSSDSDRKMTVDLGEGIKMLQVKEGQMERGITFQPVKPANATAPAKLPIPPAPPNGGGDKK